MHPKIECKGLYMPDDKILHIVSNEAKSIVDNMQIVTPSVYASIFSKLAHEHDASIDDDTELSTDLLKSECALLTDLSVQTSKNANKLSINTNKAITAIQEKDETGLNEVLQETQNLRQELEKLKEAVYKDELTHTNNRKWLHDNYLEEDTEEFKDNGTLAMIDLNYFKIVNDTHGHIIGDKVLIFIANQLKLTKQNVVRYGGDEFLILFPSKVSAGKAKQILDELRENVLTKKLKANDTMFRTSFSIGVTPFSKGDNLADIIDKADQNMYEDKTAIKKRIKGIEV
jgi:diguanylate cyclase (GGDEF)-like protein